MFKSLFVVDKFLEELQIVYKLCLIVSKFFSRGNKIEL